MYVFIQSCFLVFDFFLNKKTQKINQKLETIREPTRKYAELTINPSIFTDSSQSPSPIKRMYRGEGNNILVGEVVKAKLGELEEEE